MLTTLNWRGWEIKPSEVLIGIHSLLFYFPRQVLGTVALFLEMRIWNWVSWYKMPSLIFWSENFVCFFFSCGQFQLSEEPNGRFLSFLAVDQRLLLLAMLEVPNQNLSVGKDIQVKDSL